MDKKGVFHGLILTYTVLQKKKLFIYFMCNSKIFEKYIKNLNDIYGDI